MTWCRFKHDIPCKTTMFMEITVKLSYTPPGFSFSWSQDSSLACISPNVKLKIQTWQPPPRREDVTNNPPISSSGTKAHTQPPCTRSICTEDVYLLFFLLCIFKNSFFCLAHWKWVLWVTKTLLENALRWSTGGEWPSNRNIPQINTFIGTPKYQCLQFFLNFTSLFY